MAQLTGNAINGSYQGLLKTSNNGAVGATVQAVTDGLGNAINLEIGTNNINFPAGNVDFTGATVTGLPADTDTTYDLASAQDGVNVDITLTGSDATVDTVQLTAGTNITLTEAAGSITIDAAGGGGAAGLVNGAQTDSLKNADALVTTAAITKGDGDIVLGNNASVINSAPTDTRPYGGKSIVIGDGALVEKTTDYSFIAAYPGGIAIGEGAVAKLISNYSPISIGRFAQSDTRSVSVGGGSATSNSPYSKGAGVSIGFDSRGTGGGDVVAIGSATDATGYHSVAYGAGARVTGGGYVTSGTGIGTMALCYAESGIALGNNAKVSDTASVGGIAIGTGTTIGPVVDAVALGRNIAATRAGTVSVREIEMQTVGGGIIFTSPDGTAWKQTISNTGVPVYTLA